MPSRDEAVLTSVVRAVDQVWTRGQTWAGQGQGMTLSKRGYPVSPCLVLQTSHKKACLARLRLSPLFPSAFSFVFLWGSFICFFEIVTDSESDFLPWLWRSENNFVELVFSTPFCGLQELNSGHRVCSAQQVPSLPVKPLR